MTLAVRETFTDRAREVLAESSLHVPGFHPTELLFLLARCRGDFASVVARLMHRASPPTGLDRLVGQNAAHLSLEALVLEERWSALFDPSDRSAALRRLALAHAHPTPAPPRKRPGRRRSAADDGT
jgi:hypothetical protein